MLKRKYVALYVNIEAAQAYRNNVVKATYNPFWQLSGCISEHCCPKTSTHRKTAIRLPAGKTPCPAF